MQRGAVVNVLIVEDNPADARITLEAFRDIGSTARIDAVDNGADALSLLRHEPADLVLWDLNIPRLNGHEVLAEMRGDPTLKRIPVIVISASANPSDVRRAYDAQVSAFLQKPLDFDAYFSMIRNIKELWLDFAILPQAADRSDVF